MKDFKEKFYKTLEVADSIVITSHMSPDDDSIGSVLSVYTILKDKYPNKSIKIIYTGSPVDRYKVFSNFEKIEWVDDVANYLGGVDVLIMLDASKYSRFSKYPEKLKMVPTTITLDHHASTPDDFTLLLFKTEYPANTELIYRALIEGEKYSKEVAEHIWLGILGDTGNFAYVEPRQADVFILAKELISRVGMQIDKFRSRYGAIPVRVIPLLQELSKNTIHKLVEGWPPFQYSFIENIKNYSDEDLSAASHTYMSQYLTRVEGYSWGFVVTPRQDGTCRISSRSLPGSVNVRDIHEKLNIGGGHNRASGGYFTEPEPKICVEKVIKWIENNKPLMN